MSQERHPLTLTTFADARTTREDVAARTPSERLLMVWQLTVDAWAFKGEDIAQRRLSRDVVRIVRRVG